MDKNIDAQIYLILRDIILEADLKKKLTLDDLDQLRKMMEDQLRKMMKEKKK